MNVSGEDLVPEPTGEAAETDEEAGGTANEGSAAAASAGSHRHYERRGHDDRRNGELRRWRNGRDAGRPDARQRRRRFLFFGHGNVDAGSTAPTNVVRVDVDITVHVVRATHATPRATAALIAAFTATLIATPVAVPDTIFISIGASASVGNNSSEYGA